MLTRLRKLRQEPDAGYTLIEVLVGMGLMLLVSTVGTMFLVSTTAQAGRVGEQGLVDGTARSAMNQIVAALRVADTPTASAGSATNRFVTITANEVTFYSDILTSNRAGTATRSAPTKIDFTLANGTLTESVYAPQSATPPASYPITPTSTSVLATGLTNNTVSPNQPLFSYCSDASDPSSSCTATTNPASVALVQVNIRIQGLNGSAPQSLQSGVAIEGALS